jgi:hypothetical protein
MNNQVDINNQEQQLAFNLIANTNSSFFLTGRAGTGKTTFLKSVQTLVSKKFIVLAPTGIAAINAGGETIHSFFRFPLNALDSKEYGKITPERKAILQNTDTIIIDEVSMVRCDMIDAIDRVLRRFCISPLPFGGKQIVFSGDMFQLEPILSRDSDKELISQNYNTDKPYFFKAKVFERLKLVSIEFKKIYRQSDVLFIGILERIRNKKLTASDLEILNARVRNYDGNELVIVLTSHNETAKAINDTELEKIDAKPFNYSATINGMFDEKNATTERELVLKEGAQIMFTRNDPSGRWVNGTLGEIAELTDDTIKVKLADNQEFEIGTVTWENIKYDYDRQNRTSKKEVIGTFTQFPIKTAWAITIHKSQGLTFDNVRIDFSRGVFANGQTYVALSRARSLEGLYLTAPIKFGYVKTSDEVLEFADDFNNNVSIEFEIDYGISVSELINKKEFDKAAKVLFEKAVTELEKGNIKNTYNLFKRSLDIVVCDDCLFGEYLTDIGHLPDSPQTEFIKAVYCLYSGHPNEGIPYINEYINHVGDNVNGLYIKSRLLTLLDEWQEADRLHDQIVNLIENRVEPKLFFRGAIINETKCNIPSLTLIQSLIIIAPNTLESHYLLKQYHQSRNGQLIENEPTENALIKAFNMPHDDLSFRTLLPEYHEQNNEVYEHYLKTVTNQAFEN